MCILSPSNNSLEGLHRSLEIINLPALSLLLGYENLAAAALDLSLYPSLLAQYLTCMRVFIQHLCINRLLGAVCWGHNSE